MVLRNVLAALLAVVWGVTSGSVVHAQPIAGDPIRVSDGLIAGKMVANGIKAYLGVPFAAPPLGYLRWRPPQPPAHWNGVRQVVALPLACMQPAGHGSTSEDCLYLNIWAPNNARPGAKLPVMVYLHGGGFTGGSASAPTASGAGLAAKGVIFVAGNYRLGTFGFLAHPDLDKENSHNASGDYGLLDQLALLKWVRANIAKFGGDPGNVTLAGHSAGSASALTHHASPLSKGLFQKVMSISGSFLTYEIGVFRSKERAEQDGLKLQAQLGGLSIAQMRELPADKILATHGGPPSVDGWFLPKDPKDIFNAGEQNDVTAFLGFTRDEGYGALMEVKSAADYVATAKATYGVDAEKLLAVYPANDNWKRNAQLAARDITVGMMAQRWAAGQASPSRKPAYVYMTATLHHFPASTLPPPDSPSLTAFHGSDNSFWLDDLDGFNEVRATRAWTTADYALADKMSDMVIAFMKSENPSIPGITVPRYDPADEKVIGISVIDGFIGQMPFPGHDHVVLLRDLRPMPSALH